MSGARRPGRGPGLGAAGTALLATWLGSGPLHAGSTPQTQPPSTSAPAPAATAPAPSAPAQTVPPPVTAAPAGVAPPSGVGLSPQPDAAATVAAAAAAPAPPPPPPRVVPTSDVAAFESDHDAVVGAWGIEARPVAATLPVFGRRPGTGCPMAPGATSLDCPDVTVSALAVRHWLGRNLAWNGGVAFALGGGRDNGRLLDTYFGFGPLVGVSVLLGNWRHVAIAASPELSIVMFKGAGSLETAYVTDLRAVLEAEVHFGFIGLPSLSLGIRSGLLFRLQRADDVTVWSVDVAGATSVRGLVTDLTLRYYF